MKPHNKTQAHETAKVIITEFSRAGFGRVSNSVLQKLLYFSQAWSLVIDGRPLFEEELKAWKYGPVVPSVYYGYRQNSDAYIQEAFNVNLAAPLIVKSVVRFYGGFYKKNRGEFYNIANRDQLWEEKYVKGSTASIISKEEIARHFSSFELIPRAQYEHLVEFMKFYQQQFSNRLNSEISTLEYAPLTAKEEFLVLSEWNIEL